MQTWEYYSIEANLPGQITFKDKTKKDTEQYLNDLGKIGWELVSATRTVTTTVHSSRYRFFFKRPIS
jgi:hypothetical protein